MFARCLNLMDVQLIDSMGSDLTVVNAARVSFNKHVAEWKDSEERLIKYLAQHGHWTPFGHPQLQFRISAPIFVARQLMKHQIGLVWNEVSRRYVDYAPQFYIPDQNEWRGRSVNAKQGSAGPAHVDSCTDVEVKALHQNAEAVYNKLLEANVAPEQARLVLPLSLYTEWYWTGSLFAFSRVCNLRLSEDAQEETRTVATQIAAECAQLFPISWKYLVAHA
jgi:thymidylate synthase (FAD)